MLQVQSVAALGEFRKCKVHNADSSPKHMSLQDMADTKEGLYWGVSLDKSAQDIDTYTRLIDNYPALVNIYVDIAHLRESNNDLSCEIARVKSSGAVLMLTVEPHEGFEGIKDRYIKDLAQLAEDVNKNGMDLLIRFGHEMNGDWYPWCADPKNYVEYFRKVTDAVRDKTDRAYMVWAPNTGLGYPFDGSGGRYPKDANDERFKLLDTNKDGVLDNDDDPFSPYYPGDEYVDWVGLSFYSKRNMGKPEDEANVVDSRVTFDKYIYDNKAGYDFYKSYSDKKNKPFMLAETAASYYSNYDEGDGELAVKQDWWRAFWSDDTRKNYPLLRAAMWFEFLKRTSDGELRDYRISNNTEVVNAFKEDLEEAGDKVLFVPKIKRGLTTKDDRCTDCEEGSGAAVRVTWGMVLAGALAAGAALF